MAGITLQDRDHEILSFIARYRMATREILHRRFFDDSELNAVTKVTTKLIDAGYLLSYPLYGNSKYFVLGPVGAKARGLPKRVSKPIGPQSLITQYGILEYCQAQNTHRERLTVSEIQKLYRGLLQRGIESVNYVTDGTGDVGKLQSVRVDGGGPVDHTVRKLRLDMATRSTNSVCVTLNSVSRFEVVCITYSVSLAEQIQERIAKEILWCPVKVSYSDNLLPLLRPSR